METSFNQSVRSVAISEISQAFNTHFNNGQAINERSDNLSLLNSARSPSNYGQINSSINQAE